MQKTKMICDDCTGEFALDEWRYQNRRQVGRCPHCGSQRILPLSCLPDSLSRRVEERKRAGKAPKRTEALAVDGGGSTNHNQVDMFCGCQQR